MLQAYQGYFENGRFKPLEELKPVEIPDYVEVYITVTGRTLSKNKETTANSNNERINKRMEMVESLIGCMAGYDIDPEQLREERLKAKGLLQ